MNNNRDSVYNLLTKLCERYSQDPAKIKRFRAIAFEIILRKKRYRILKRKNSTTVRKNAIINELF